MRTYLETIHTRSDTHKKRFAFLTSFGITLIIFSIWTLVKFSPFSSTETIATDNTNLNTGSENTANAIAPLDNLASGVKESYTSLKNQFNSVKGSVRTVNLDTEYEKMRTDALNNQTTTTQ